MIIGLTGQSGAGKSTVAKIFARNGFLILDTDEISRQLIPGLLSELCRVFGDDILDPEGKLDRKKLARKAFSNDEQTEKLNGVMHRAIMTSVWDTVEEKRKGGYEDFLIDGAALYEAGADKGCDAVIAVIADKRLRRKRVMSRDGISAQDADKRFARQKSNAFFRRKADFVIVNQDLSSLEEKVCDIIKELKGKN